MAVTPAFASDVLLHLSKFSAAVSLLPIHSTYLPLPPLTLIHALVVSHNSLLITGYFTHNKGKVNLATSLFFNQLLLFGPLSVLSAMLGEPCPLLLAPEYVYIYGGVHLFNVLSGLGPALISISGAAGAGLLLDTLFLLVDAVARSDGVAALGVDIVRNHPNPIVNASPFAALFIGTGVGVGSLLMLGLITFESTQWTLRTPLWLTSPSLLVGPDYISSFLASLAYYVLTSPLGWHAVVAPETLALLQYHFAPILAPLQPLLAFFTANVLQSLRVRSATGLFIKHATVEGVEAVGPLLSAPEARVIGAMIVFTFSIANRFSKAVRSSTAPSIPAVKPRSNGKVAKPVAKLLQETNTPEEQVPAVTRSSARKSTSSATPKKRK